jgi:ATP-dependent protease ClpP protease subunit
VKKIMVAVIGAILLMASSSLVFADDCRRDPFDGIIGTTAYTKVNAIDFETLRDEFIRYERAKVERIIIDLFSFGGSVFDAMAMGALIEEQTHKGIVVEIRARGIVASAGLIVMVSGSKGHRLIDPNAMVMWHEMSVTKWLSTESVSDKEDEAKVLRRIEDKTNTYLASRSLMKPEEISNKIKKHEFWMDADEAVKYGFADGLLGAKKPIVK